MYLSILSFNKILEDSDDHLLAGNGISPSLEAEEIFITPLFISYN